MGTVVYTGVGTVAATGKCSITIQAPGTSVTSVTGAVSVVNSPVGARWTVTLAGEVVGQLVGTSSGGPFTITGPLPLVLKSSSSLLAPGGTYTARIVAGTTPSVMAVTTINLGPTATVKLTGPVTVETAATHPLDVSGPVTITAPVTVETAAGTPLDVSGSVNVGTVSSITETVTITGTAKVQSVVGTALSVADVQDWLATAEGSTATGTPTALTLYGEGLTLVTTAPTPAFRAHGVVLKTGTAKWARLWNPGTTTTSTAFTTAPPLTTNLAMRYTTSLTGKRFVSGTWTTKVHLHSTKTAQVTTLTVRYWRLNRTLGGQYSLIGSVKYFATIFLKTGPLPSAATVTVTGSLPPSPVFNADTELLVDIVAKVKSTSSTTNVLKTEQGPTFLKVTTPGYATPVASATWTVTLGSSAVTKSYSALAVIVKSTTSKVPYAAAAWDATLTANHSYAPVFSAPFAPTPHTSLTYQAIVPMGNEPGDKLKVAVKWTAATKGLISVYGLTRNPGQVRSDGRAYPAGARHATATATTTTPATVVAGVSGLRILVQSMTVVFVGNEEMKLEAGTTTLLAVFHTGTAQHFLGQVAPPGGLLLGVGEDLTLAKTGTPSGFATVTYDYVY